MSVFTAIAASAKPTEAAGEPSAIVSGAGTAGANGTYTERGDANGRPYYNLEGQPDNPFSSSIEWNGADMWTIRNSDGDAFYTSGDDVAFPWLVTTWGQGDFGVNPVPVVSEG